MMASPMIFPLSLDRTVWRYKYTADREMEKTLDLRIFVPPRSLDLSVCHRRHSHRGHRTGSAQWGSRSCLSDLSEQETSGRGS